MTESICVGITLSLKNNPQGRWNRVAAGLRREGAVQVGGMFEFEHADPDRVAAWLREALQPEDQFLIRVVVPDAFTMGLQTVG